MVKPYLIFDRQGNGVDINNMFDKTRTCYGCPDRTVEPRCHGTCEGYKWRQEKADIERAQRANTYYSPDDKTYAQRMRNAGERRRQKEATCQTRLTPSIVSDSTQTIPGR
jgi:hypothetical protein